MTPEQLAQLQAQMQQLQAENHALHQELATARQREADSAKRRTETIRFGARLLVPLIDRHKVARSFGALAGTVSQFAGTSESWPTREQVLGDARTFGESCVRFVVRRRTMFALFSIIAASIPFIQVWLVVRQNEIIANQTKFAEIQVYDMVGRSMTEGDRNARLVTGALLSRADLEFLSGVVAETFDPDLAVLHGREGVQAGRRRLEDAAFRGPLVRAVVRGVEIRAEQERASALFMVAGPMLERIVLDAEERVPTVLRLGTRGDDIDGGLLEEVDDYIVQVGDALAVFWLLGKAAGEEERVKQRLETYLHRVSGQSLPDERHVRAYRDALEALFIAVALEPRLGGQPVDWSSAGLSPDDAVAKGLATLRAEIGGDKVDWSALEGQLK